MRKLKRAVLIVFVLFLAAAGFYFLRLPPVEQSASDPRQAGEYTFLCYCSDEISRNTDAIVLIRADFRNGTCSVCSLPRDTRVDDSVVDGGWSLHKINSAFRVGGVDTLKTVVQDLTGVPVDYTMGLTLESLASMIDAVGGVDFTIPCDMNYDDDVQDLHIHFTATGEPVHLTGAEAVEVMRYRHNSDGTTGYKTGGDIDRLDTQRAMLSALVDKVGPVNVLPLLNAFSQNVETGLTGRDLFAFGARALVKGMKDNVTSCTLPGKAATGSNKSSYWCVDPDALLELVNTSLSPYVNPRTMADLDVYVMGSDRNFHPYNG